MFNLLPQVDLSNIKRCKSTVRKSERQIPLGEMTYGNQKYLKDVFPEKRIELRINNDEDL